jgi:hypothetical protein
MIGLEDPKWDSGHLGRVVQNIVLEGLGFRDPPCRLGFEDPP